MNIAGMVVRSRPEKAVGLMKRLRALKGVEVHHHDGEGRLIVTIEGEDSDPVISQVEVIQELQGVLSANLVYQQEEDLEREESYESE